MSDEFGKQLLLEEFRQAWEHYRQVENHCSWVVGFLYTVALGGIGAIWRLASTPPSSMDYVATLVLAFFIGVLSLTAWVQLAKERVVLAHYVRAWRYVRQRIYGTDFDQINARVDVYEDPGVKHCFSSDTAMTTLTVWLVTLGAGFYLLLAVLGISPSLELARVAAGFMLLLLLILALFILYSVVRRQGVIHGS